MAVKLELQLRNKLEFVSCNETQNSGTNNLKITIGELNFVSRIIHWPLAIGTCPASAGQGGGPPAFAGQASGVLRIR